jgi:hypothetical protein
MPNSLQVFITKKELSYILSKARLNFFEYIYYKSEYLYYEVVPIKVFGITIKKELKKLSKNKSELVYNKTGFKDTLDKTDLRDLFINYNLILDLDIRNEVPIIISDLKLLLDIGKVTIDDLEIYTGKKKFNEFFE